MQKGKHMPDFSTMAQMMQNTANPQPRGMPIMRGVAAPAPASAPMPPPGMMAGGPGGAPPAGGPGGGDPMSQLMEQIVTLFQQQTGRMPTQEEVQTILAQVGGGGAPGGPPPMPGAAPGMPPGGAPGGGPPLPPNTNASTIRR